MSSRRAVALDGLAVLGVGAVACAAARETALMTAVVAAAWLARAVAWSRLPRDERPLDMPLELAFLVLCAGLGGLNDWNTVVRHGVYSYGVPSDLAPLSSIPAWMLAYWGLILRLVTTLGLFAGLGEPGPAGVVRGLEGRHAVLRVALLLGLVFATRQSIYRLSNDPWLSWLPFAAALALHPVLFPWGARERRLALLAAVAGPLAEAALIGLGGLHRYELGWLMGVPLWIALWWILATLVWSELSRQLLGWLRDSRVSRHSRHSRHSAGEKLAVSSKVPPTSGATPSTNT